jgi:hypothetical protein
MSSCAAVVAAITTAPPRAIAAPPQAPPDAKAEAVAHFNEGLALYDEGAWAAALAEFLEARRLYPLRNAGYQAALCLEKLQRYDEALEQLEGVLRVFGETMPPSAREVVQHRVLEIRRESDALAQRAAHLAVRVAGAGAGAAKEATVAAGKTGTVKLETEPAQAVPPPSPPPPVAPPPAVIAPPRDRPAMDAQRGKATRIGSTVAFAGAGALGLAGGVLALHTFARAIGEVGACNATAASTACWNRGRGAIQGEGTAATIVLGAAGAALVTGAVLFFEVEGRRGGTVKVEVRPAVGGGSLLATF